MPNRINTLMLQEYTERYRDAAYLVVVGYEGMDTHATHALRNKLAENKLQMKFVKNHIAKLAFEALGMADISNILEGQCAFIVGTDPVSMTRIVRDFAKEHKALQFRGSLIENTVLDQKATAALADAASKEELKGQVVGAALSGGANLAGALLGPASQIAGCVKSLVAKLEESEAA
ncbi:MAG: 50S ribosomal protein L10 [Planctomycetes bacterium]|nr:50S ribosomal protein L10 [Planctomycetota bacterium]